MATQAGPEQGSATGLRGAVQRIATESAQVEYVGTATGVVEMSWAQRLGSGGVGNLAQRVGLSRGVVAVCLRLMQEPPAHTDDGDGGIGQAGKVARQATGAHARAVLVTGDIAHVVNVVLDLPPDFDGLFQQVVDLQKTVFRSRHNISGFRRLLSVSPARRRSPYALPS